MTCFYTQGRDDFFKSRIHRHRSTVFRVNMPPGPLVAPDPRVIALLDAASFPVLFDSSLVEKKNLFTGTFMPSTDLTGGYRTVSYLDVSEPNHAPLKKLLFFLLSSRRQDVIPESEHEASDVDHDEFEGFDPESYGEDPPAPEIDEKDVVVLTQGNFTQFIEKNRHVMVEFYAPWCGHCQALAPEYAAAATGLKDDDVALAKVDATEENDLAQKYDVQGFPTVVFFVDGVHKPYPGQRTK